MAKRFEKAKAYTEKYRDVLLPCRYCHNTDIRIESERTMTPGATRDAWSVTCSTPKCDCTSAYTSVKDAVAAWNIMAAKPIKNY